MSALWVFSTTTLSYHSRPALVLVRGLDCYSSCYSPALGLVVGCHKKVAVVDCRMPVVGCRMDCLGLDRGCLAVRRDCIGRSPADYLAGHLAVDTAEKVSYTQSRLGAA